MYDGQARQMLKQLKWLKYHWEPQKQHQKTFQPDSDLLKHDTKIKWAVVVDVNEPKAVYRMQISNLV